MLILYVQEKILLIIYENINTSFELMFKRRVKDPDFLDCKYIRYVVKCTERTFKAKEGIICTKNL